MNMLSQRTTWLASAALIVLACAPVACGADDVGAEEEAAFKAAALSVAPSVVRIETVGGTEKVDDVLVGTGPTTGLIVDADGYILSSAFNFAQKPTSILVTLPSGQRTAAKIVARDDSRMMVLLKIESEEKLPVPTFGSRDEMAVGQWTIAVGRTFDQALPNLSVGVLSAKSRVWGKAIQCDAKISPANYGGPLVDIRGRVLGILVPLSPQGQGEVAGAEWYDSGIGFAIPLAEWLPRLETLKQGGDLQPGLMGVSLKKGDMNADPAVLVACAANGPAAKAGLKPQDKIIEVDGTQITRQVEFRHALGPKYAGDVVRVVALRGEERIEAELELAAELAPYAHPFIGILPRRDIGDQPGVVVRYIFAASPAAEAGLQAGDRITKLVDLEVADAAALAEALAAHAPGAKVSLTYTRGEETRSAELTLAKLSAAMVPELPPAHGELPPPEAQANVGVLDIKIPEEQNECAALVPENYHPGAPHALLVVLATPGNYDRDQLVERYRKLCHEHETIVLLPRPADAKRWDVADAAFIRKAIEDVAAHYNIDRGRILTSGYQVGGAMAFVTAFAEPELIRGVVAIEAAPPARAPLPESDPARRWWFYLGAAQKSKTLGAIRKVAERLEELEHPVVYPELGESSRDLNADELDGLGRWLDSLDRL